MVLTLGKWNQDPWLRVFRMYVITEAVGGCPPPRGEVQGRRGENVLRSGQGNQHLRKGGPKKPQKMDREMTPQPQQPRGNHV